MSLVPIAVVDDERFDAHRSMQPHPERPERLSAARRGLRRALPSSCAVRVEAREAADEELLRAHAESYIAQLREALHEGSGWGHIDADTFYCPDTERAAWLAAGGGVDLGRAIMGGEARHGMALLRPPGHHACRSRAMGFCLLNNVAVAAADALAQGMKRVAIVDWDVHHGNGTQDIFYEEEDALFVSLHQSPLYPGTGALHERGRGPGEGYTVNLPMPSGSSPNAYGAAFEQVVLPVLERFEADLVLVSAGLDAHERDPLASLALDSSCFAAMTTALKRHVEALGHGRLALFLEGGYDLDAIEESVEAMAGALLGTETELPSGRLSTSEERAVSHARDAVKEHWLTS